jgi:hypothetical protein
MALAYLADAELERDSRDEVRALINRIEQFVCEARCHRSISTLAIAKCSLSPGRAGGARVGANHLPQPTRDEATGRTQDSWNISY